MRKRYRYILSGIVTGEDKISKFRLIAGNKILPGYDGFSALRVEIPDDLKLEKWNCDPYSTTDDPRTLDELGYDVMIYYKKEKRWKIHNEFKGIEPHAIPLNFKKNKIGGM